MLIFSRLMFAFLGLCALLFAWQFAMTFSHLLLANQISILFFTTFLFSLSSVAAAMLAFRAMREAAKLTSKQRLVYAVAYLLMMLPSIAILVALNMSLSQ